MTSDARHGAAEIAKIEEPQDATGVHTTGRRANAMLRKLSTTLTTVAVLFCGSVSMAHALSSPTTVYSSGDLLSTANATEMTANLIAEPFSIAAKSEIVEVQFYTREFLAGNHNPNGVALASSSDSFSGSFYWYILNDNAGAPGTIKYQGVASIDQIDFTRLDLAGTAGTFDVINNAIVIPSVLLDAGVRYWLVIHNGNPQTNQAQPGSGMFWETTNTNNSTAVQPVFDAANPPDLNGFVAFPGGANLTHVYRITGQICERGECPTVTEPGTLALLGGGLSLLGFARPVRRRK
jgi:hypothetical protein